jgi:hypothetical protein
MADNEETQIDMLATLGSVSHPSADESTTTKISTIADTEPIIDDAAQGAATAENITMAANKETQIGVLATLGPVSATAIEGSNDTNAATTVALEPVINDAAQGGAVTTAENITMANNEEKQIGMLATLGSVSGPSVDGSNNPNAATTAAPDPEIDYAAEGGAVTTSENKKHSLMSLFKGLDRDVFYAMEDVGLDEDGGPCIFFALAQRFPGINQQEFLDTYKSAGKRRKLRCSNFSFLHRYEGIEHGTRWIMVKSRAELVPIKSPDDQIAAFAVQNDIKDFWPYQVEARSSLNVCRRAAFEASNARFNQSNDTTQSASLSTEAAAGVANTKKTKISTTTEEAAKLLSSLTGSPQRKTTKATPRSKAKSAPLTQRKKTKSTQPKSKSASLKAAPAPATSKGAATSATTEAAANLSAVTPGSPRRKKAKISTSTDTAATTTPGTTPLEETDVWKAYVDWLDNGSVKQVRFTKCPGYRLEFIEGCVGIEAEKLKKTLTGFSHLCGEGLHNYAAKASENETVDSKWPVVGAIRCNQSKDKDAWMWMVSMLEPHDDRKFAIHSPKCVGELGDQYSSWPLCKECNRAKHRLYARCRRAVDIRAGPINENSRIDTLVCPTLARKRMEQDRAKFRRYQTKLGQMVAQKVAKATDPSANP